MLVHPHTPYAVCMYLFRSEGCIRQSTYAPYFIEKDPVAPEVTLIGVLVLPKNLKIS